jgi:hypothetical protein
MAKLDGMRYPSKMTAEEAVKIAKTLVEEFNGQPGSQEAFAQALGHSTSNSGSYIKKVADARSYGILPTRGLEATDLAYRVTHPENDAERREAIFEMYQNVSLLSEIYDKLNGNDPPSNLWSVLTEITDANRNEAKSAADAIRSHYNLMLEYDSNEGSSTKDTDSQEDSDNNTTVVPTVSAVEEDGIFLKIGDDEHRFAETSDLNIDIAIKILQSKKEHENQPDKDQNRGVQSKLKPDTE